MNEDLCGTGCFTKGSDLRQWLKETDAKTNGLNGRVEELRGPE